VVLIDLLQLVSSKKASLPTLYLAPCFCPASSTYQFARSPYTEEAGSSLRRHTGNLAGGTFARGVAQLLHPQHGALIVNMHSGPRPGLGDRIMQMVAGGPVRFFDPENPQGRELLRVGGLFRCAAACFAAAWVLSR
jgi:hypothetical protein